LDISEGENYKVVKQIDFFSPDNKLVIKKLCLAREVLFIEFGGTNIELKDDRDSLNQGGVLMWNIITDKEIYHRQLRETPRFYMPLYSTSNTDNVFFAYHKTLANVFDKTVR
jgi:hypothetical protein